MATKILKENKTLLKIAEKAINSNEVSDEKEAKKKIKEYVKSRLDETCDKLNDGFNKGIEKSKYENAGIAEMVAAEMMKD
jgi:predicted patatin/cPLA2 family phospholipase